MAQNGGARPGAGSPRGPKKKTLERKIVEEAVRQQIFKIAKKLIVSQTVLATGSISIFKRIFVGKGKEKKPKLVMVDDVDTIVSVLEETDGLGGVVDNDFYVVMKNSPENKAIDSLLDRALGKARQNIGLDGGDEDKPIPILAHVFRNDSNKTDQPAGKKNPGAARGNSSKQNNIDAPILDTLSSDGHRADPDKRSQ